MRSLELKVPPPLVMLATAFCMWWVTRTVPTWHVAIPYGRAIALILVVLGIVVAALAALGFRRASTTINPMNPSAASTLLTDGVYRYSRNPIYLADVVILIGLAIYLNIGVNLALVALFVVTINRLQILPEERLLKERFGADYSAYRSRVRRWI